MRAILTNQVNNATNRAGCARHNPAIRLWEKMSQSVYALIRKHEFWIIQLIFVILILIALRDVLALPGTVGRWWDWEIPVFADQIAQQISRYFFVWDYQFRGGFYSPYRPEGLYYLFTFPLAIFGGAGFTKLAIVILLLLSANTMRWLTRRVICLGAEWSVLAGMLYMFSPAFYSRLMAGHLHMLTPYALLPLFFGVAWQTFHADDAPTRTPTRQAIATGVLYALEAIHPSYLFMATVILILVIGSHVLRTGIRRALIRSLLLISVFFSGVSAFWALPSISGYLTTGTLFHSGWPMQQPDVVTPSAVVAKQANLLQYAMRSVFDALRMNSETGFATEYAYPVPAELASLWLFVSFLLPVFAFGALLKRNQRVTIILAGTGLFGVSYIAGANFLTGAVLLPWLLMNVFPVWAQFAITLRMLPLVALAYAALAPRAWQDVADALGRWRGRIVQGSAIVICAICTVPFLAGSPLIDPRQILHLRSYEPTAEDRAVYEFLRTDQSAGRVAYVPPPTLFYAQLYDLGTEWFGGLSPQPEFLLPYFDEEAWRGKSREFLSAKLLGLGAANYLVFPHGKFTFPYAALYPKTIPFTDYTDPRQRFEREIAGQLNLVRLDLPFRETVIYRNTRAVPRIYATTQTTLLHGNSATLLDFVESTLFDNHSTFFVDGRQPVRNLDALATQVTQMVIPGNTVRALPYPAAVNPAFLITGTIPGVGVTLTTPRDSVYRARVQVTPSHLYTPRADDPASITFAQPDLPALENWTANVSFNYDRASSDQQMHVWAHLDGATSAPEFVQFGRAVESIDLMTFPIARITSQVENPAIQQMQIVLSLDFDDDGNADAEWHSEPIARANSKTDRVDALAGVRQAFPGQPNYRVVQIAARMQKSENIARPIFTRALYWFVVGELGLDHPIPDPQSVVMIPLPTATVRPPMLTLSFDATTLTYASARLEYRVDCPAMLYAYLAIMIPDLQGNRHTFPLGTRWLEPFQANVIEFDLWHVPNPAQLNLDQAQIQMRAQRLYSHPEFRSTTLTISRLRILNRAQDDRPLTPPYMAMDGKSLAFAQRERASRREDFITSEFTLSAGTHRLTLDAPPDATYLIASIEIAPATNDPPVQPPTITIRQIDPTRFVAHVENARAPFFLVFSESYHDEWQAATVDLEHQLPSALLSALSDYDRHPIQDHYRVNGYANAWRVTEQGSYDVVIEFLPQRLYEGGWILSLATLGVATVYLGVSRIRRRVES